VVNLIFFYLFFLGGKVKRGREVGLIGGTFSPPRGRERGRMVGLVGGTFNPLGGRGRGRGRMVCLGGNSLKGWYLLESILHNEFRFFFGLKDPFVVAEEATSVVDGSAWVQLSSRS